MTLCCSEATRDAFDVRDAVGQRQGSAGRSCLGRVLDEAAWVVSVALPAMVWEAKVLHFLNCCAQSFETALRVIGASKVNTTCCAETLTSFGPDTLV